MFTCLNWLFSYTPFLFVDIFSLIKYPEISWGAQLYICLIETAILSLSQLVLSVIELVKLNSLISIDPAYKQVLSDTVNEGLSMNDDEKKRRQERLNKVIN